ncbi:MAG: DUF2231 domain-containing protein [Gammaproteobacteria bacterium]
MIQIIPNWHPIFVHFTVALFSTSVGFYTLAYLSQLLKIFPKIAPEFEIAARWCLWSVGIIVIGTVLAGLQAYNTVRHDEISHIAMTDHRNWAIPTAGMMVLIALWSLWRTYKQKPISLIFIIALLIVQGLLLATAWRGAELVFRYGLGVMSLPQAEGMGHHHHHEMPTEPVQQSSPVTPAPEIDEHHHDHNSEDHHS